MTAGTAAVPGAPRGTLPLTVRRGVLLFERAGYEALFGRAGAVVLLREGVDLLVVPLHEAAVGGHLVKLRNAAGDRAIDALDLLRDHPAGDGEHPWHGAWDDERGALRIAAIFA